MQEKQSEAVLNEYQVNVNKIQGGLDKPKKEGISLSIAFTKSSAENAKGVQN